MNGFLTVCYHYIRPVANDPFPRILGTREDVFREHVQALQNAFQVISLSEAVAFFRGDFHFKEDKPGLLFTFDDGLSDHYTAARILAEHDIKAVFFIPTSILTDKLPINPVIIHYCLAHYGIDAFLKSYEGALEEHNLNFDDFAVTFKKGVDDPAKTISEIKSVFKYRLASRDSRNVLLCIYRNLFEKDFSEAMKIMHVTREQIQEMLDMGHHIGAHSHSHLSIASANLSEEDFKREMIFPKEYLEHTFTTNVKAFSYPFGERQDCFSSEELLRRTSAYALAFTVDRFLNTKSVSPLELGRHSVQSRDNVGKVLEDLQAMVR